jgi:hypothetical protein
MIKLKVINNLSDYKSLFNNNNNIYKKNKYILIKTLELTRIVYRVGFFIFKIFKN